MYNENTKKKKWVEKMPPMLNFSQMTDKRPMMEKKRKKNEIDFFHPTT